MSDRGIFIIGGGPVGATLALALLKKNIPSTVIEARKQGDAHGDQRALALSYGTRQILEKLGVWAELAPQATAINTIHISQRGSLGRSRLKAADHGLDALGYVLSYGALSAALDKALTGHPDIQHQAEALSIKPGKEAAAVRYLQGGDERAVSCRLVVLADGGRSLGDISGLKRETREYGHDALVTKVKAELPHDNIAYERFTPDGPVALLPNGPRDFSLVWTGEREQIAKIASLDNEAFLVALHQHFGDRVGCFLEVGKRISFPLKLSYLDPTTAPHLAVIGNAAQTMHPVAGQGFNVGLRDAWDLAQLIARTPESEWGAEAMFKQYRQGRQRDSRRGLMFTDFLVNLFSNDLPGLHGLRGMGLGLLDAVPVAKRVLVSKMSFGSRG